MSSSDNFGLPSPPSSRKQRSTDETRFENGEIFHCEAFRAGAPGPLPWLPLNSYPIQNDEPIIKEWERVRPIVLRILRERRIDFESVSISHRRPKDDVVYQHTTFKSDLTLLVMARFHFDFSWKDAIKEIRETLNRNFIGELVVEFLDKRATGPRVILPISATDPIVSAWERIRPKVHEALRECPWTLIEVIKAEKIILDAPNSEYPVTIFVTVPLDNLNLFVDELLKIKTICTEHGFPNIEVRFRHCQGPLRADRSTVGPPPAKDKSYSPAIIPMGSYNEQVQMGVSMGARGSPDIPNGTFGGYLELVDPKSGLSRGIFGITCYHVLEPAIPQSDQDWYREHGLQPTDKFGGSLIMDQPGHRDHYRNLLFHQDSAKIPASKAKAMEDIQTAETAFAKHRKLGSVLCGSGLRRLIRDHRLDWALLNIEAGRIGKNNLPSGIQWYGPTGRYLDAVEMFAGKRLSGIGRLLNEDYVYKKGKATGCKVGRFSHIKTDVRIEGEELISSEYVFVDEALKDFFSKGGDSGSMVFSSTGAWLGLLWGGSEHSGTCGTSYVTDAQRLIEDIERTTGCRVQVPK